MTGATTSANMTKPDASGSTTSTTTKAGTAASEKIRVPAPAIGTACPIVASRAVAIVARMAAVDPFGQAVMIQKNVAIATANIARTDVRAAATPSWDRAK